MLVFHLAFNKKCFHLCCQNICHICGIMWDSSVNTKVKAVYLVSHCIKQNGGAFLGRDYVSQQHPDHSTVVRFLLQCVVHMHAVRGHLSKIAENEGMEK